MEPVYNRSNFYRNTFCIFREADIPGREPDYVSGSGSRYWFEAAGVYRESNHWGRAAKCKWRLLSRSGTGSRLKSGYAKWSEFASDNDREKLYFLKMEGDHVMYCHKSVAWYSGEFLRTSADTMKRIKKVRTYLKTGSPSQAFCDLLINSDMSVHQINQELATTQPQCSAK